MSADFNTEIKAKGTKEELQNIINAVMGFNDFCKANNKEYHIDLEYLKLVDGDNAENFISGDKITEKEIADFLETVKEELLISFEGPYGRFVRLIEVCLFDYLAQAVPTICFEGEIYGFSGTADQTLKAVYKKGVLSVKDKYIDIDDKKNKSTITIKYNPNNGYASFYNLFFQQN